MICITDKWIFQDAATTIGDGTSYKPYKADSLTIEIFGTATSSTVIFEGQGANKTAWYAISAVKLSDFSVSSQTTTIGELWQIDLTGLTAFRARVSVVSGGTVSVYGKAIMSSGV